MRWRAGHRHKGMAAVESFQIPSKATGRNLNIILKRLMLQIQTGTCTALGRLCSKHRSACNTNFGSVILADS